MFIFAIFASLLIAALIGCVIYQGWQCEKLRNEQTEFAIATILSIHKLERDNESFLKITNSLSVAAAANMEVQKLMMGRLSQVMATMDRIGNKNVELETWLINFTPIYNALVTDHNRIVDLMNNHITNSSSWTKEGEDWKPKGWTLNGDDEDEQTPA